MRRVVVLVGVNLVFAAVAGLIAWRWWTTRRSTHPVAPEAVDLRVRARPPDEDRVEQWVAQALVEADACSVSRTSGPVVGDAATLVEVPADRADEVVAAVLGVLLADGYEVRRTKGRQVQLRRGGERVTVDVAPST
jgi:hypothetical protein